MRRYQQRTGLALTTLRYFDAAAAARLLRIPVHVAAARFDPTVPPPGQFVVYNALAGHRDLFVLQASHFDYGGLAAEETRLRDALAYFFKRGIHLSAEGTTRWRRAKGE